jgi:hypothetical protein
MEKGVLEKIEDCWEDLEAISIMTASINHHFENTDLSVVADKVAVIRWRAKRLSSRLDGIFDSFGREAWLKAVSSKSAERSNGQE